MELLSIQFFFFVVISLLVYYLFPQKHRWKVLLAASYAYYLIICNKYIIYMVVTTITTYIGARLLDRALEQQKIVISEHKEQWTREERKTYKNKVLRKRRAIMLLVVILNFGILGFLKYFDFFADGIVGLLQVFGIHLTAPDLGLLLPLGISFYTFQTMGYLIDVYQEKVASEKNFAKLALFVSFFPQIIQGPIAMYDDLAKQLYVGHKFEEINLKNGALLVLWGAFKKMVIADRAVKMIELVTADSNNFTGIYILMAALMYALQLYADFSGGIDIVRGIGEMFGIRMAENFKRPYFSKSLTEYWHRWHMTLGNWIRNYVFYPLSISKKFLDMGKWLKPRFGKHISKVLPTGLASLITFLIIGIWHGANGKYVAFGLWNGLVILIGELIKPLYDKILEKMHVKTEGKIYSGVSIVWTFLLVLVGYYFDIARNFSDAMNMLIRSVNNFRITDLVHASCLEPAGLDYLDYWVIGIGAIVILVASLIQEKTGKQIRDMLWNMKLPARWSIILVGLFAIVIFGYYGPNVDPAEFVYMQF